MDKEMLQKFLELRKAIAGKFMPVDNLYVKNYKADKDEPVEFIEDKLYRIIFLYVEGSTPETFSEITEFGFDILAFVVDEEEKIVVVNLQKGEVCDGYAFIETKDDLNME